MTPQLVSKMDLRGLEPPEPMMRLLEAVATRPPSVELEARLERRPMFLIEELGRRSQPCVCRQCEDGTWLLSIPASENNPSAGHVT